MPVQEHNIEEDFIVKESKTTNAKLPPLLTYTSIATKQQLTSGSCNNGLTARAEQYIFNWLLL